MKLTNSDQTVLGRIDKFEEGSFFSPEVSYIEATRSLDYNLTYLTWFLPIWGYLPGVLPI
jgi:hypothetical protein